LFLMTGRWNDASMANGVTDWSCPPQALGSCASVTVRYGVVEITLSANNLSSAGASDATGRSWRRGLSHATAPSALEPIASNRMIRRSCREDLKSFPEDVRLVTGYVLYLAQVGSKHPDAKPLRGFGGAGALAFSRSSMTSTATRTGRSTRSSCKGLSSPFMPFRRSRGRGRRRPSRIWNSRGDGSGARKRSTRRWSRREESQMKKRTDYKVSGGNVFKDLDVSSADEALTKASSPPGSPRSSAGGSSPRLPPGRSWEWTSQRSRHSCGGAWRVSPPTGS